MLIQRLRPSSRSMLQIGVPLMWLAFVLLTVGHGFAIVLVALAPLGIGIGLVRPGNAAGASVSVEPEEQGGVTGILGGVTVVGNVFGPMPATTPYQWTPVAPYLLNLALMTTIVVFVFRHPRVRSLRV